jgi:uncharacterized protein YdeI (YjbR/CyaY-like superfamily)
MEHQTVKSNLMNETVNFFFEKKGQWHACYHVLRGILLSGALEETLKWGNPCYMHKSRNIVLIHGFKDYCALLFFKGALLEDSNNLLIQQTENVQAGRQMRFTSLEQINQSESAIRAFVQAAIEVEVSGRKVVRKSDTEIDMPVELTAALQESPELSASFFKLTPGRQRAYALYIGKAKQSNTRIARIEKYRSHILSGKGIDD